MIDWFTVIAQIVNCLILVALLKYFLYDRIIQAMDKREERIQSTLQEAENERVKAREEAEYYHRNKEELTDKQEHMLAEAREEADQKLRELTRQAREEVGRTRSRWQESLEKEKRSFLQNLKRLAVREVYGLSRRALKDLADADLEERVVDVFVRRFKTLKKEDKEALVKAVREEDKVTVRSGFELSGSSRQKITKAVREQTSGRIDVTYDTDPQIIMGIGLKARGEKVAWSIRDYLAELEGRAMAAIEKETQDAEGGDKSATKDKEEKPRREDGAEKGKKTA